MGNRKGTLIIVCFILSVNRLHVLVQCFLKIFLKIILKEVLIRIQNQFICYNRRQSIESFYIC